MEGWFDADCIHVEFWASEGTRPTKRSRAGQAGNHIHSLWVNGGHSVFKLAMNTEAEEYQFWDLFMAEVRAAKGKPG